MNLFRSLFLSLSLRERVLLIAFLATMAIIWALYLTRSLRSDLTALRSSALLLSDQEYLFSQRESIEVALAEALANLDSERTYSANQLEGRIDDLARSLEVRNHDLTPAITQDGDIYATHLVRLRIDNGNLSDLVAFNQAIQEESPYIVINQCQISANQRDPRLLDASFEISSIELKANVGI